MFACHLVPQMAEIIDGMREICKSLEIVKQQWNWANNFWLSKFYGGWNGKKKVT